MVMAEIIMGRNVYRQKINTHWQTASNIFILKCSSVSEFHRHNLDLMKIEDAIFVCLNFTATVRCKKALAERQTQGYGALFERYGCVANCRKTFRSAPAMQLAPYYADFDVNVALSWYILVTFSVNFRCLDLKDSRIVFYIF